MLLTTTSERQGRAIDRDQAASMETKKQAGTSDARDPADSSYRADDLIAQDIDAYLVQHQNKTLLRFITCGSVDDGNRP